MGRVLTDGEVEACWQAWKHKHHVELIRGAEAAVLDRMAVLGHPWGPLLLTGQEVLAKQRQAWDAAVRWMAPFCVLPKGSYLTSTDSMKAREAYLNPSPRAPRTVTLSDGTRVTAQGGGSLFTVDPADKGPSTYWSPEGTPMIYKFARTPEDAEALADLVRHPFEGR